MRFCFFTRFYIPCKRLALLRGEAQISIHNCFITHSRLVFRTYRFFFLFFEAQKLSRDLQSSHINRTVSRAFSSTDKSKGNVCDREYMHLRGLNKCIATLFVLTHTANKGENEERKRLNTCILHAVFASDGHLWKRAVYTQSAF